MKTYRLSESGFEPTRRQLSKRLIIKMFMILLMLVLVATGFLTLMMVVAQGSAEEKRIILNMTLYIIVPLFSLLSLFGFIAGWKIAHRILRERWDSYELILTPVSLLRRQAYATELEIFFEEIVSIREIRSVTSPWDLQIKTAQPLRAIHIPGSLQGYEEVRARLSDRQEIEPLG
jgi:hypothetical protein